MIKLISKPIYLKKLQTGGLIPKAKKGLPIGTKAQYDLVTQIYQGLVDRGVSPQSALELVNQKIAVRGWTDYSTGDLKVFPNVSSFVKHLVDWHGRMYPNSLKARIYDMDDRIKLAGLQNQPEAVFYYKICIESVI